MNKKNEKQRLSAPDMVIVAAFAIITIGTVCIPALLAFLYSWRWMLCYPVLFVTVSILSARIKKNRS